jgi:hypothetical protein
MPFFAPLSYHKKAHLVLLKPVCKKLDYETDEDKAVIDHRAQWSTSYRSRLG